MNRDKATLTGLDNQSFEVEDIQVGPVSSDKIRLGSHRIDYDDDFMSFECKKCEESFEVPDIFQGSTAVNKIIYQFFIFAKFMHNPCPEPIKQCRSKVGGNSGNRIIATPKPGNMYWSDKGETLTKEELLKLEQNVDRKI